MSKLRPLNKLNSVNRDKDERNSRLERVKEPVGDNDAATKKWIEDNFQTK